MTDTYFPVEGVCITYDIADAIFTATLEEVIRGVKEYGDDPEYDTKLIDACRLILKHFGKPQ